MAKATRSKHEVLANLERCYPGIRFHIVDEQDRVPHLRIYIGAEAANLHHHVPPGQEIHILQALSGGSVPLAPLG